MPKFYVRKFGKDALDPDQEKDSWFEIWDAETDERRYEFRGEDAEKKAKAKLNTLKGGKKNASNGDSDSLDSGFDSEPVAGE